MKLSLFSEAQEQEHMAAAQRKKMLRRMIAERKREHPAVELAQRSARILERILSLEAWQQARTVFAYMALPGEVQTRSLIEQCWREGKRVAVPRLEREGKRITGSMHFYEIRSFDCLSGGAMNILEPDPALCPCMDEEEQALMILPGVAFDRRGNRLGYGGGCYDRYLQIHDAHPTVAVAYDFQMLEEVPREGTDLRPQLLLTETLGLRFSVL